MTEATGLEAKTIHRLLRYSPDYGGFTYNEHNQLSGPGLLITDESSMADVELAHDLLQAIENGIQVVMVGDIDQLPSVGPGSVLRDAILSGVIPTVRLKYNYRQAAGSGIADYALMICRGQWEPPNSKDIHWMCISDDIAAAAASNQAAHEVVKRVVQAVKDGLGPMDFQVLSPQRKGAAGVNNLNNLIQDAINPKTPNKPELTFGKSVYRLGSKVMVTSNDYGLGVFNGDLGLITGVMGRDFRGEDKDGKEIKGPGIFAEFDGEEVFFDIDKMGILDLAYASTVHKSQGSEFKLVIMVCVRSHYIMLQKNLLYTGVTRAKNDLVLIAQDSAIKHAVENDKIADRFSLLQKRLRREI
jgi:exodeoxyribonuclease V alpha subunit